MTDDEAKTKWCPFVRISVGSGQYGVTNREDPFTPEDTDLRSSCIASACMAWRTTPANGIGYCGLVGKPS